VAELFPVATIINNVIGWAHYTSASSAPRLAPPFCAIQLPDGVLVKLCTNCLVKPNATRPRTRYRTFQQIPSPVIEYPSRPAQARAAEASSRVLAALAQETARFARYCRPIDRERFESCRAQPARSRSQGSPPMRIVPATAAA